MMSSFHLVSGKFCQQRYRFPNVRVLGEPKDNKLQSLGKSHRGIPQPLDVVSLALLAYCHFSVETSEIYQRWCGKSSNDRLLYVELKKVV